MTDAARQEVDFAAGRFAALLARHMPDRVVSLNLVGSAADGDFRPGRSDLDFVAVLRAAPNAFELEALGIIHHLYASDPTLATLDGIWLTDGDLAAGPDAAAPGPATENGEFHAMARGNRNPVTWFALRDRSRTVVGTLDKDAIWSDRARLLSWTRDNVDTYWAGWLAQASRLSTRRGLAMLGRAAPMWGVLGISRMHATLTTGAILSKSEAGRHARAAFGTEWHSIVEDCLRIRAGSGRLALSPWKRRRMALDFVGMAIAAIRALDAD